MQIGSVAHHVGAEPLAVRRALAGRVDHAAVCERLDRCRQPGVLIIAPLSNGWIIVGG
jgi:hypothetical protein